MRLGRLTAIVWTLALLSSAASAQNTSWPVGVEREVDTGVYMQVFSTGQGWRIWRVETRSGVSCKAVKSARARPHPAPIGVGSALAGGTPALEIIQSSAGRLDYLWQGRFIGRARVKIRPVGARFWDDRETYSQQSPFADETPVEVNITSWEYPELLVGYSDETAVFEPIGLRWALSEASRCATAGSSGGR